MNQDVIQVPFEGVAVRKLHDLFERGYTVCGVAIQRAHQSGNFDRGAITTHGVVMWWQKLFSGDELEVSKIQQPTNALQLAEALHEMANTYLSTGGNIAPVRSEADELIDEAASELRRQHARIAELEAMLDAIGAGGVGQSIKPPVQPDTAQIPDVRIRTSAPAAWAIFTRAGFCRMWSQDRALVERTAAELGVKAEPLYRCTGRTRQALKQGEQVAPYTGDVARIMREAGMTFHLGLPHKAVVEQMTRVVDLVYAEASIKAAVAFAAPKPAAQPDTAPAAWAILSDDGTAIRLWSKDKATAQEAADKHGRPLVPLYTAPQPTENLNCKSTQKRLATLWGYVKQEPARQPLPADTYTALAHRIATRFTYSTDRSFCEYYFAIHTLEQFVRAIEQAHGITGGQ